MGEGGKEEGGRGIEVNRGSRRSGGRRRPIPALMHRAAQHLITGAVLHFLCSCTGADLIDQI